MRKLSPTKPTAATTTEATTTASRAQELAEGGNATARAAECRMGTVMDDKDRLLLTLLRRDARGTWAMGGPAFTPIASPRAPAISAPN